MNIFDIQGELIKIGKTSITVKNRETGKTKGIVRNLIPIKGASPRLVFEHHAKLRECGLWANNDFDEVFSHVFESEEGLVYIHNTGRTRSLRHAIERTKILPKLLQGYSYKKAVERLNKWNALKEKASEHMTVIEAEIY